MSFNDTETFSDTNDTIISTNDEGFDVEIFIWQLGVCVTLFLIEFFIPLVPVLFLRNSKFMRFQIIQFVLSLCNGFAGGVLIGVGMLHAVQTSCRKSKVFLSEWGAPDWLLDFPLGYVISFVAMCAIIFIEKFAVFVVIAITKKPSKKRGEDGEYVKVEVNNVPKDLMLEEKLLPVEKVKDEKESDGPGGVEETMADILSSDLSAIKKTTSTIFLTMSLSVHVLFEGFSFGIVDSIQEVISIAIALLVHSPIECFAFGILLEKSIRNKYVVVFLVLVFASFNPIATFVGVVFSKIGTNSVFMFINMLLLSFSGGVFLYIGFFEFFFEFVSENKKLLRLIGYILFLLLGFFVMAVLAILE